MNHKWFGDTYVLVVKESHKITYIVVFCKFLAAPVLSMKKAYLKRLGLQSNLTYFHQSHFLNDHFCKAAFIELNTIC